MFHFFPRMYPTMAAASVREREQLSYEEWATTRLQPYYRHLEDLMWPDLFVVGGGVSKDSDKFMPKFVFLTSLPPTICGL